MAQIDGGRQMRNRRTFQRCLTGILCVLGLLAPATPAKADNGEFTIAVCKSDALHASTGAFQGRPTYGMRIRRACIEQGGKGIRALVLANVVSAGRVPRGAFAIVWMDAPPGTQFKSFTWGGQPVRADCRYQAQIWAQRPDKTQVSILNKKANRACKPPQPLAHKADVPQSKPIPGTTQIIAKLQCYGAPGKPWCSARRSNYLKISFAEAVVVDQTPPTATITLDTPLATGQWVSGRQPLNYQANDNVGIRSALALLGAWGGGNDARSCALATQADDVFNASTPCPNGPGQLSIDTTQSQEGTQTLAVRATDAAGNIGDSPAVAARIDNTPPGRVDVAVENGDAWRNTNSFAVDWTNPPEPDRAPIVAAGYKLCPADGGVCIAGQQPGDGLSRLPIAVPGAGQWKLSLWRQDAAGNQSESLASDPVTLRYDPDPPQLGFEPPSSSDPTLVAVDVSDKVSGVATGTIEISQTGSGVWRELPTQVEGDRLLARFDDAALPAGGYVMRAHATDQAQNEATTDLRLDGQPMALTLPVRVVTGLQAGFHTVRIVTQTRKRHGHRVRVRRRVPVTRPSLRVAAGKVVQVAGRLTEASGQGIAGQPVTVFSGSSVAPEQPVATVQTGSDGGWSYSADGSSSRTLRFSFSGSPTLLPAQASVTMTVPALTSLKVDRRRLRNGQSVTFTGALRTVPAPPGGKLLELQVRLPKGWETFRTIRTDPAGHWTAKYHFTRTFGVQRYRFRARLPQEAGYPFAEGGSRPLTVVVRGRR